MALHEAHTQSLLITRLGADGDGVGELPDGKPVYVPFALAGEQVDVALDQRRGDGYSALLVGVRTPSSERVEPPCVHFGRCGGCSLQHWRLDRALAWKAEQVTRALTAAGFAAQPAQHLVSCPPGRRRRIDFAVRRSGGMTSMGLHEAGSDRVLNLSQCPALHADLEQLIGPMRACFATLRAIKRQGSVIVNLLDSGPDILLRTDAVPDMEDRHALVAFAKQCKIARLCVAVGKETPEPVSVLFPPRISFSGMQVAPPPGVFLQASAEGEAAIAAAILAGLPERKTRIIELYAGCGSLTAALATRGKVSAYEGNQEAALALRKAAAGRPIEAFARDLARQPLAVKEFAKAGAIVLDPPFVGAGPQMQAIAASTVGRVIYVSCNPRALNKDARALATAGYRLEHLTVIDQFPWTSGVESVAVFGK